MDGTFNSAALASARAANDSPAYATSNNRRISKVVLFAVMCGVHNANPRPNNPLASN
jgi:hypothetical protein